MQVPVALLELILARLERVPADSPLAHRASGVRGSLLRLLDVQRGGPPVDAAAASRSLEAGLSILRDAASGAVTGRETFHTKHDHP